MMNKKNAPPQLKRTVLTTSRMMDFFSEKELTTQTGHAREDWPLVILKELVDNAMDACEDAQKSPEINIIVDKHGIEVSDNGPGIPKSTVKKMLDFSIRVSNREAYVAPTRGAQGNALKAIVAVPFVLDGGRGRVEIIAKGIQHNITVGVDSIRQKPVISHDMTGLVKNGNIVRVFWPDSACSILTDAETRFLQIAEDYTFLNPHLTLNINWFGKPIRIDATSSGWVKWLPSDPTSAYWYEQEHLSRLIAGYIGYDRDHKKDRTVRELVAEFRGLSATAKQKKVLDETGLGRVNLSALANDQGVKSEVVGTLLKAMQEQTKPVKPAFLGVIGQDHFKCRFEKLGCEMKSFDYRKIARESEEGLPYVIETAFAWCEGLSERRIVTGVNWSPGILNPFRQLGRESLDTILEKQMAGDEEPVVFLLHRACPRVEYTDRGKSAVVMGASQDIDVIKSAVLAVTKKWYKQRMAEERRLSQSCLRRQAMTRSSKKSIKAVAWDVMETAYRKASTNGTLPAQARQIMYAARPEILERTECDKLDSDYFTQKLLPNYISEHPEQTEGWNVVFDARGHFMEPHTGIIIGLGTLGVHEYLQNVSGYIVDDIGPKIDGLLYPTMGPNNRYSALLFIEKEGFMSLFEAVKLAERYDIAIMSTKGMSVTAARQLVDTICGGNKTPIPLLVLHDFDKAGFSILGTLQRDTQRYKFSNNVNVINLGIRLEDVQKYNLVSEDCSLGKSDPTPNLKENGATQEEIDFLCSNRQMAWYEQSYIGKRVELNAFSSGDFIEWIESKLKEHGIKKVIPDNQTLKSAYRRAALIKILNEKLEMFIDVAREEVAKLNPQQLTQKTKKLLKQKPEMSWDQAIADIADNWAFNGSESKNSNNEDIG